MKKKSPKTKKHGPSWALALVAILAPVLGAGITPIFAESAERAPQTLFDYSLFNINEFRLLRRAVHSDTVAVPSDASEDSHSAAPVNPCDPTHTAAPVEESKQIPALSIGDLTYSERETLRLQLRHRVCPDRADPGYLALCRKLLKALPAVETKMGLSNPNQ